MIFFINKPVLIPLPCRQLPPFPCSPLQGNPSELSVSTIIHVSLPVSLRATPIWPSRTPLHRKCSCPDRQWPPHGKIQGSVQCVCTGAPRSTGRLGTTPPAVVLPCFSPASLDRSSLVSSAGSFSSPRPWYPKPSLQSWSLSVLTPLGHSTQLTALHQPPLCR